jgi:DNA mismatch repair protein MLH1
LKTAIKQIYEPYLPKKTYPFVYISVKMDPKKIDVNVHPTKEQVGFVRESDIVADIQGEIRQKLQGGNDSRVFVANSVATLASKVAQSLSTDQASIAAASILASNKQQKSLPQNTVRLDTQTGQMDNYLKSNANKRPLPEQEFQPVKRRKVDQDPTQLASVQTIIQMLRKDSTQELVSLFKQCIYVGWINPQLSLVQFNTKLYIVDVQTVT